MTSCSPSPFHRSLCTALYWPKGALMTRSIPLFTFATFAALVSSLSLGVIGCEDGPKQPYGALPPGGRDYINEGDPQATVDDEARKDFTESTAGKNKQVLCTRAQKRTALAKAFLDPILPVRGSKSVDLTVGGKYTPPLTIEDVEKVLCQGRGGGGFSSFG